MKIIAGIPWSLHKLKDTYGRILGQKIYDADYIKVECYNAKCKKFYKEQEIPDGGEGLLECPSCEDYFKVPGVQHFGGSMKPDLDEVPSADKNTDAETKEDQGKSSGTGFFIDNSGHVVTNFHVIEPCKNKVNIIYKNKEYKVDLIAKDKNLDLALLKANLKNDYSIKISDKPIKKLQSIIAAGYPLSGILGSDLKYTSGIISSLKGINDDSTQIQIDAALNPGNSGGPIVDKKSGELVAVAVSVASRRDILEGINFGIKVSQVKDFLYANGIKGKSKKTKNKNLDSVLENSIVQITCQ